MAQVGMHEAKTHLSKLVERALAGEEIVIARHGEPAVRLTPVQQATTMRELIGSWKDEDVWMAEDFDDLPEEMARAFGMVD